MNILKYFKAHKKSSANTAKERLQIIISQERVKRQNADFLPQLQQDLIEVIAKYFKVDSTQIKEQVRVDVEWEKGHSVLELNITLPDMEAAIET